MKASSFLHFCLLPFAFCLLISLCSCGKIGDPLPPIPRAPLTVSELTASQQGTRVVLSFPLARTPRSIRLARVEIYRLIESADAPAGLPQDDFSARSTMIAQIPGDRIPVARATVTYNDLIQFVPGSPSSRYRYAVRIVNANGVAADFSNYAVITPITEIAQPPVDLRAKLSQLELEITWSPPKANESGTSPANIAGYNIYRHTGDSTNRLNSQPLRETRQIDRSFQFGTTYEYFVRALSLPPGSSNLALAIESNDSQSVELTPKDTFPPAPPDSIKIASINGVVSMFWPSNSEPDLAGYHIYRSEDGNAPPERWVKLTPRIHTPTTFRDDKVTVGKQYFYQLTAVDTSGNESARSATVSETVNP